MLSGDHICFLCDSNSSIKRCICDRLGYHSKIPRISAALISSIKPIKSCYLKHLRNTFTIHDHKDSVKSVCMSVDGSRIVSIAFDNTLRLWNTHRNIQEAVLTGHTIRVTSVFISEDGRWIVYGNEDRTVRIFNVARKTEQAVITGYRIEITSVYMTRDGRRVYLRTWTEQLEYGV